jgi:mono/diheme cytochrome c family protein
MKRLLLILIVLVVVAAAAAAWIVMGPGPLAFAGGNSVVLAEYKAGDPSGVPAGLKDASLIVRGEYLARAADCEACHTAKGGTPFAGGLAFNLPFGTLYSPNITPDKETGIGSWSNADFLQAVHKGIAPDGMRLYPAFPYPAYTLMTDTDALAIKAYLFSLAPVHAPPQPNTLKFPYNQRSLMGLWSVLFNSDARFAPNPEKSPEWNRGAYLAEALAHCGDCHTPRNPMQALDHRRKFSGAVAAGWKAYNITPDKDSGIGGWRDETLARFLSLGHAEGYGTAAGPMGEAVDKSLAHLAPEDIKALVTYLRSVPAISDPDLPAPKLAPAPIAPMVSAADAHGAALFSGVCAGCHGWTGTSPVLPYASLTGARSVNDPSARNVAQAIVWGVSRQTPTGPVNMPAFGNTYSNTEVAALANYVTARFGAASSRIAAADVARIRQEASQ